MGTLEQCSGRAGLPGVWGEEAVAMEAPVELFLAKVLRNPQNGRAGVATQAVGSAPVFPRLQVTEATTGIQPEPQKSCSQHPSGSSLGRQGACDGYTAHHLDRS